MYNNTVKPASETMKPLWFRLSIPSGGDFKKVLLAGRKSKTIAVFSFLGAVRQLTKQRALPAADKNRGRYGTTNHSVLALIKRLEQTYKNVTSLRLYLDELIRQAHLVYSWQMNGINGAVLQCSPGVAMPKVTFLTRRKA